MKEIKMPKLFITNTTINPELKKFLIGKTYKGIAFKSCQRSLIGAREIEGKIFKVKKVSDFDVYIYISVTNGDYRGEYIRSVDEKRLNSFIHDKNSPYLGKIL